MPACIATYMNEESQPSFSVDDAFDWLLSVDNSRSRDEPDVARSIGEQLQHMELDSMPLTLQRRIRDTVGRIKPENIIEVGSGIGHMSAWLFDCWDVDGWHPKEFVMVEGGPKFGMILKRLIERYDAGDWAKIVVGKWEQVSGEALAWNAANKMSSGNEILPVPADCIIIDVGWEFQNDCVRAAIPLLKQGGILITPEPEVPTVEGMSGESDDEVRIEKFQEWMDLIKELVKTYKCGFTPLYGGSLVSVMGK